MSAWSHRRDELHAMLTVEKLSYDKIAERFSTTRNAVAGACYRLNICHDPEEWAARKVTRPARAFDQGRHNARRRARRAAVRGLPRMIRASAAVAPDASMQIRLADAASCHCRYIDGETAGLNTMFCGMPTAAGKSWCGFHVEVVSP